MKMFSLLMKALRRMFSKKKVLQEEQPGHPAPPPAAPQVIDPERHNLLTPKEAAAYLRISRSTLFRYKRDNIIVARKMGGRIYFLRQDLATAYKETVRKGRV